MMLRAVVCSLGLVSGVCFANNTLESMDVGQAAQMLMGSGKDCAAVINALRLNEKSTLIDCTSLDGKHELRWRVDDTSTGRDIGLVLKWPIVSEDPQTKKSREEGQKLVARQQMAEVIRREGHACQEVTDLAAEKVNTAIVHCKVVGEQPAKYLLIPGHGARYSIQVIPMPQ